MNSGELSREQVLESAIRQMHATAAQRIKANAATIARLAQHAMADGWIGQECSETIASIVLMGAMV